MAQTIKMLKTHIDPKKCPCQRIHLDYLKLTKVAHFSSHP